MWMKIFIVLCLTMLCEPFKEDYEYEELNLLCNFEQMNEG